MARQVSGQDRHGAEAQSALLALVRLLARSAARATWEAGAPPPTNADAAASSADKEDGNA